MRAASRRDRIRLEVWRLDLASRGLVKLFGLEGGWAWSRDPSGERLLLMEDSAGGGVQVSLADLETGAARQLTRSSHEPAWVGQFLADGRLLLQRVLGEQARWFLPIGPYAFDHEWEDTEELWLADRDGTPLRRLPRRSGGLRLGSQPADGQLLVAYTPDRRRFASPWGSTPSKPRFTTYVLDLESGDERLVGRDLMPIAGPDVGPDSVGSRLLDRGAGSGLLLLDPGTLETRVILGSG